MAGTLFIPPSKALDANADPYAGAKWFFYATGTTTPQTVYTTFARNVAHSSPVVADSSGKFANIFFDPALVYRAVLKNADESVTLHDIDPVSDTTLATLADDTGASFVGFLQTGTGATARTVQDKMRDVISAKDFGVVGDGVADDTNALLNTAIAARTGFTDGTGRTFAGEIFLPPGKYKIDDIIELAPTAGLIGLTINGSGCGGTEIVFDGSTATIKCTSSRQITWRDISFISSEVDDDQIAFTINQTGNPLRSWRFERCEFQAFYKCFAVTGTSMCSEFYFHDCKFLQCYWLMDNDNDQAFNWNFVNCDWENDSLTTSKDKTLAAVFNLKKGSFIRWTGGSFIIVGQMVYYNLTASGVFARTSHKVVFDGVRIELVDDGAGGHASLIDRVSSGYVNGSNSPTTSLKNFTIINRGTIPTTITYAKVWANCSLELQNGECEGGKIIGILDATTAASNGSVMALDVIGVKYEEDTAARVNSHDQHNVTIVPDNSIAGTQPLQDQRLCSLSVPSTAYPKYVYVRGPTGSLPQGGTTVNLPAMPNHTMMLRLFCFRFGSAGNSLQVDLKDQADTTTYQTITLASGDRFKEDTANAKEMGFEIPANTPLMLKFIGTAEVVKGVVGVEYL